ncbi:CoB--CoM heterodisulfide reductase iron-sulfur subunit A family protein [Desulfosporosinus sp. BICA1-9]|uniref:CoB--CoM heterodisulfide reductase iron-sulfur subunit A family protein n=1 Tax=Desulfosporosinus sp. BICA1-9 TaxID=1531958 RepID=UPI00054BDFC2|nr:CoB--CoM heterodisulfide reductase iron-sulfur subunit A family protein [Desulfosporosinus sp. BICA1-9]KJS47390.1 MAG: heterodisulfide reductase [Peptococcaceae bacterium BRH_c23]KJS87969.1 MAG: heterodisulfide reductase [Desulfosporosinus sp. BICA1-9]HBW39091.1 CoB--CoM heterodisulfide reductase iron-sulfur subunit A family protein [Desulfosporosinus sp.]
MEKESERKIEGQPVISLAGSNFGDVMVVGGGISGIQAALDLATAGFKVYMVEKSPTIGGKMSQLDKTFPTNDCSMCIESPKFSECNRHPNIKIMTYTEVDSVVGEAGDFKVTLIKKPRYVIESKCTGCTVCVEYCPVMSPDQFNQEISKNKAIHIYFAQAIPLVSYIDESCLYFKERKCTICQSVCKSEAIDFNQTAERVEVNVGAIVLSSGFEPFNPKLMNDYGYGKFENVVTSLDFERLLCATGPYEGEILRASDKRHPHKIAWIHCVGSRQVNPAGGNSYCSGVCCTYTQKQVILTKDHDDEAECTIFHNDIRSYGKDFERFYQRTEKLPGIRFIRSYVSIGKEISGSKNVTIRYSTLEHGVKEEEFDMVVLSVGLNPPADAKGIANMFGIELNSHGFCKTNPVNPMETTRPGIFISGAFQGPVDIPESVMTASGAGSQCGELLDYRRGNLAKERIYPPERDTSEEEPRVGVYVCHCGANIGRIVDVPSTVEYALTLPNVVYAEESLFICSTEAAAKLSKSIREKGLNRVVVAACTPRTHEPLFRDTLREAGINQYYYDMANIREHCSWVHSKEKEKATQKAQDIVRMSVARACRLEPLQEFDLPVNKAALVVGGGFAGLTSALSIANQGHVVYLVEKDTVIGGMARRIHYTLEGMDVQGYLRDVIRKVYQHRLIHVYTDASIIETGGFVGNFVTKVKSEGRVAEINHGATILATGAEVYQPTEYLYGEDDRVITHLELEEQIAKGDERLLNSESLVMIQCVGCRNEDRNYCSRICCSESIKNALKLKEINPQMDIYILFRDMRTYGYKEDYYREAASKDVRFIRYEPQDKPQVEAIEEDGRSVLRVTVTDLVLGKKLEIAADALSLAVAVIPSAGSQEATKLFKVNTSLDGFFQEAHVKLRLVDFSTDGIYLCGIAHYPKHISETISQAYGAAGRVLTLLSHNTVVASGSVCEVNESNCISCGACIAACTYGAIEFHDTPKGRKAVVNPVLCKGDGLCNAKCPTRAISLKHYTHEELMSQIDAAIPDFVAVQ